MDKADDGRGRLRSWWLARQGLTSAAGPNTIAACVRQAGWLPTSGSTGIYLSMRARLPGVSREAVDRAAIDGIDVIEVPGALGRPSVVVPREEMTLALRLHSISYDKHLAPLVASGSMNEAAFRAVGAQACRALDEGPLSTADIRASITHPDAGELLASALNHLAIRGIVRRFPVDGRFDSSKYMYELRHPDDRPDLDSEGDPDTVATKAARLFLRRHGPATVDEITWWTTLAKGVVRKAIVALGAEPVSIAGWTEEAWLLPDDVRAWKSFRAQSGTRVLFLPYRDPFIHVRRPPAVMTERDSVPILDATLLKPVAIRDTEGVNHHAIVAGDEMVGVWEYDSKKEKVVSRVWSAEKGLRARVAEAAADTERVIQVQLGDAKLSAVDPPARRAKRIAFCRAATGY